MNWAYLKAPDCGVGCGTEIMKYKTAFRMDIYPCEDKPLALVVDLLPSGQLVSSRNNDISALVPVANRSNIQKQQKLDQLW